MAEKMNIVEEVFQLPISITENGSVIKTLQTKDTYIDKDIKVSITTPDATFKVVDAAAVTASVSTTDTTYTSDTATAYPIVITADATAGAVKVGVDQAGFAATTDTVEVAGANAEQATKTIYVKEGHLAGEGSAEVDGNVSLTKVAAAPTDGSFYVKASAEGSVKVDVAGWLPVDASADTDSEAIYTVKSGALANTGDASAAELDAPVLTEGGYLYIKEGYFKDSKISLATLVPDDAVIPGVADGKSNLMYKTVAAYDSDGKLIAGTMGDATLGAITANDASATIDTVSVAADGTAFKVTGSKAIAGTTSVAIAERGLAETTLSQNGVISGTANVEATLAKIGLAIDTPDAITVTPVIAKEDATTAKSGDISTTAPAAGHYVAISTAAIEASKEVLPKVATEGYGTTAVYSATGATVTAGAAASGTYYVAIEEASHSVTKQDSEIGAPVTTVTTAVDGGDVVPVVVAEASKVAGAQYVKIDASAETSDGYVQTNAKCTSTEGYITATDEAVVTRETVSVADASATAKYIKVYDGSFI